MTTKKPTRRQAHWAKFLFRFNFVISYTLDKDNTKTNALTRQLNDSFLDDYNN